MVKTRVCVISKFLSPSCQIPFSSTSRGIIVYDELIRLPGKNLNVLYRIGTYPEEIAVLLRSCVS